MPLYSVKFIMADGTIKWIRSNGKITRVLYNEAVSLADMAGDHGYGIDPLYGHSELFGSILWLKYMHCTNINAISKAEIIKLLF